MPPAPLTIAQMKPTEPRRSRLPLVDDHALFREGWPACSRTRTIVRSMRSRIGALRSATSTFSRRRTSEATFVESRTKPRAGARAAASSRLPLPPLLARLQPALGAGGVDEAGGHRPIGSIAPQRTARHGGDPAPAERGGGFLD
jgi:hypothetical protein